MIRAISMLLMFATIGATSMPGKAAMWPEERAFPTPISVQDDKAAQDLALAEIARDLCDRQVVMLGENGFHGDGKTIAFKVALIQRLVDGCGFNGVFLEASHYDFAALDRALRSGQATPEMFLSAVGQKWNQSAEFTPLRTYLFDAASQIGLC